MSREPQLIELLKRIRDYNDGKGMYDFSRMSTRDREMATIEAWEIIRVEIDGVLEE